jgi:hypothetical protein
MERFVGEKGLRGKITEELIDPFMPCVLGLALDTRMGA